MFNWHAICQRIRYFFISKHAKGYGIHSPFVFEFVRELLYGKELYYSAETIQSVRSHYNKSKEVITRLNLGAESKSRFRKEATVSQLCRTSSIPSKYGDVLFKMMIKFKPLNAIELGSSIGMSTLYLAIPDKRRKVFTIEGNPELVKIADKTFKELELTNMTLINDTFDECLPNVLSQISAIGLAFIDGNHTKASTLRYFYTCLEKSNNDSIFVFDDIHWSKEMSEAWEEICKNPSITVSIDLFRLGIVFFRKECQKQHFIVRY